MVPFKRNILQSLHKTHVQMFQCGLFCYLFSSKILEFYFSSYSIKKVRQLKKKRLDNLLSQIFEQAVTLSFKVKKGRAKNKLYPASPCHNPYHPGPQALTKSQHGQCFCKFKAAFYLHLIQLFLNQSTSKNCRNNIPPSQCYYFFGLLQIYQK